MVATIYRFAHARFDARSGVLVAAGREVTVRPRTAAVLAYLLDNAGKLVGKDELLREVWPDLVVTDNSLAQCVTEIRRELGDADETILRTVHRRGYVMQAEVSRTAGPAPASFTGGPSRERRLSLLVLPLANLGGDPDQDYFAEGLTEDLTTDLGRIPGAFVISRGTAYAYRDRRATAQEIGRELGVQYLVEGSVRRAASVILVNLSLSETRTARQLWTERFEAPRSDLPAMQRSMSGKVAQILHLELIDFEAERVAKMLEGEADAHDLATRAWSLWYRAAPATDPEVEGLVRRAIELDPRCTLAWIMLANVRLTSLATRSTVDTAATLNEAEAAARHALALDPDHPTVNCTVGATLAYRGRFEEALGFLERQVYLNPNFAVAQQWRGIVHILMGDPRLAIPPLEQAIDRSPRDPRLSTFIRNLSLAYLHAGDDVRGLIFAERSVRVPKPWPRSYETLAMACWVSGLPEEARAAVAVLREKWPDYSIAHHRAEMMSDRPGFLAQRGRLLEALRAAGLPDQGTR